MLLSSKEQLLLSQRIQGQFPAPAWQPQLPETPGPADLTPLASAGNCTQDHTPT